MKDRHLIVFNNIIVLVANKTEKKGKKGGRPSAVDWSAKMGDAAIVDLADNADGGRSRHYRRD